MSPVAGVDVPPLHTAGPPGALRRGCDAAAREAALRLGLPVGVVVRQREGRLQVIGSYGLDAAEAEQAAAWTFLANAMAARGPFIVGDAGRDPRVTLHPQQSVAGMACFAAVPVPASRGALGSGALGVAGPLPRRLPEHAVDLLLQVRDDLLRRLAVGTA